MDLAFLAAMPLHRAVWNASPTTRAQNAWTATIWIQHSSARSVMSLLPTASTALLHSVYSVSLASIWLRAESAQRVPVKDAKSVCGTTQRNVWDATLVTIYQEVNACYVQLWCHNVSNVQIQHSVCIVLMVITSQILVSVRYALMLSQDVRFVLLQAVRTVFLTSS